MSKGRRGFKQRRAYRPDSRPAYWQTEAYNQQLFNMFQNDLIELALSRFKWVGLPETCNARYLEWILLTEGAATLAYPSQTSDTLLSLKAVQQGAPNMYDEPRAWRAIGATGKTNFMCNWSRGVWIWENATRYPLMVKINIWARELADILRTKQINRYHMRMPLVISAPQDRAFDAQNFYKSIGNGEPFVLAYDNFSDIQTNATMPERAREYIGDKLQTEWANTWDAVYRELGIDSMTFKAERMIEDEVNSTMQPTELARLSPLTCRRTACDKLNARFAGKLKEPITVVWARDNITDNYDMRHRYETLFGKEGQ